MWLIGIKPLSLVWHYLEPPIPTVFEKDLNDWIESMAWTIAKEISEVEEYRKAFIKETKEEYTPEDEEEYKEEDEYEEDEYEYEENEEDEEDEEEYETQSEDDQNSIHRVSWKIHEIAHDIAKSIENKYIQSKFLLIARGDFRIGKTSCLVKDFSGFVDFGYEAASEIRNKAIEILVQYIPQGKKIEVPRSLRNPNFEKTLDPPIPAMLENVLKDWIIWIPRAIAGKISDGEIYENTEQTIKELLAFEIEKILDRFANLGSKYVAVTTCGRSGNCEGDCRIMTVKEFIDKLYKSAYFSTLEALNKRNINLQILNIFYE
jgi:hypothetical protein